MSTTRRFMIRCPIVPPRHTSTGSYKNKVTHQHMTRPTRAAVMFSSNGARTTKTSNEKATSTP